MRSIATILSTLALTFVLGGVAAAQDRPREAQTVAPDISYEFGDDEVVGDRYVPEGSRVLAGGRSLRTTLVRPRVHFVTELLKSVERL